MSDLDVGYEDEALVRGALAGCKLIAYHATRLLPRETLAIRDTGLRVFSRGLFDDKINAAFLGGAINVKVRDALLAGHMAAPGGRANGNRSGISLTLRRGSISEGARNLLAIWGGEGISYAGPTARFVQLLRTIGTPSVVCAQVPVYPAWPDQLTTPDLARLLLGARRSLPGGASLYHPDPIPAEDVLAIWQPGDAEYDALVDVPTS